MNKDDDRYSFIAFGTSKDEAGKHTSGNWYSHEWEFDDDGVVTLALTDISFAD